MNIIIYTRFESVNLEQFIIHIQEIIKQYSNVGTVQELIARIRGGQSVRDVVEAGMKEGDVPVVYWRMFEEEACKMLKDICDNPSYQDVFYIHAPISEQWQEEMWITDKNLDNWF